MELSNLLREESKWKKTENGAWAKSTTGSYLLDFFSMIGAARRRREDEITHMFDMAFEEDPLGAMKCLFYTRDIRGGLGERKVFRILLEHIANTYPEFIKVNLELIPEYGRWDDLYSLMPTPLEEDMCRLIRSQLDKDIQNMKDGKPISLLSKWLKKADSKNVETKMLGIYTAAKLGFTVYDYKRISNKLRRYLKVVEQTMSERRWGDIEYPSVPSKAMMNYRGAFYRHDEERFKTYLDDVASGKKKINAGTLYPYDIIEKILYRNEDNKVLEIQWENLPNYVNDLNALVMADVSGSMYGRPMATSIGLALYFAERNVGAYHNLFMTFSSEPQVVEVKGKTITDKVRHIAQADWGMSTDLSKAFMKILKIAVENKCTQEEMPKALIIISDMEIDRCTDTNERELFYDTMSKKFEEAGYCMPNVIFWNVDSRHNTFLADGKAKGVQLLSGSSVHTFRNLVDSFDKTPVEMMYEVLNSERYECVRVPENK